MRRLLFGPIQPKVASAINELGTVALQKDDTVEAKAQFNRMLQIYRSVYPGGHYLIGTATSNLASACLASRETVRAEKLFREAVAIFTHTLSPEHLNTAIARVNLGGTLLRQRRFAQAEVEVAAGYQLLRKQMNPSVSWVNSARTDLAEIYGALSQPAKQSAIRMELAAGSHK